MQEKDIYTHLKNGGDPQELYDAFLKEINAAQQKVDEEAEAEKIKAKENEAKVQARKTAVDALSAYFALVLPKGLMVDKEKLPGLVEEALDSLEETIKLMENTAIKVKINGKPFSIFDL